MYEEYLERHKQLSKTTDAERGALHTYQSVLAYT